MFKAKAIPFWINKIRPKKQGAGDILYFNFRWNENLVNLIVDT